MVVHELPNCGIYAGVGVGLVGWGRRDGRVGVWMGEGGGVSVCTKTVSLVSLWPRGGSN